MPAATRPRRTGKKIDGGRRSPSKARFRAAIPEYAGKDFHFHSASPALRFGMFLPIWNRRWRKDTDGTRKFWHNGVQLNESDTATIRKLADRNSALFRSFDPDARLLLVANSIAPFTTGLGNEHPLENGFAFLNPYGLPYLPGSGVKGVVRQAAQELADGQWSAGGGWNNDRNFEVKIGDDLVLVSMTDLLFGREPRSKDKGHLQGALRFWDVIPQIQEDGLTVEIMTPHFSHYYRDGDSPHDSGQPNPISFLTVPPSSRFEFHVICDRRRLKRFAPALAANDRWQRLMEAAFSHAFEWLGFGAKTAVGYGHMQRDHAAEKEWEREQQGSAEREKEHQEKERQQQELSRLPEDARWVQQKASSDRWRHNNPSHINNFLNDVKNFLAERETLSDSAHKELAEQMEKRWKGILENPDATKGKWEKAKFKPGPREIAHKLRGLKLRPSEAVR